jgi:hypothetical protein
MQEDYRIRSGRLSQKLATLNCLVKLRSVMAPASVADPGCLSRILIFVHPGSRIQKQQQRGGGKIFLTFLFFVATNFTKLKIILFRKKIKMKILSGLSRQFNISFSFYLFQNNLE